MIIVFFLLCNRDINMPEINNLIIANVNTEDQLQVIKKKRKKKNEKT